MLQSKVQALPVAGPQLILFLLASVLIQRAYRMDDILCLQMKPRRDEGFSFGNFPDMFTAVGQKLVTAGSLLDSMITARPDCNTGIGCIHDRICAHPRNIISDNL